MFEDNGMIHYPIMQIPVRQSFDRCYCPYCNGAVTIQDNPVKTPPMIVQIADEKEQRKRSWLAHRQYCHTCQKVHDLVVERE